MHPVRSGSGDCGSDWLPLRQHARLDVHGVHSDADACSTTTNTSTAANACSANQSATPAQNDGGGWGRLRPLRPFGGCQPWHGSGGGGGCRGRRLRRLRVRFRLGHRRVTGQADGGGRGRLRSVRPVRFYQLQRRTGGGGGPTRTTLMPAPRTSSTGPLASRCSS